MARRDVFVDRVGGNNANTGLTYAQRIKDLTGFAIQADDDVKVAKTPDPTLVGSATWTDLSKTVTLASAVTLAITTCESVWTAATSVTASLSSTVFKQGANSSNLVVAGGFTTGRIAHFATGLLDLSTYQQISFSLRGTIAVATGVLQIKLCSDTAGLVALSSHTITDALRANVWKSVTIDTGGALSAVVQSVALYAISDPGAVTLNIDNIIACKASASADSLTLTSLIGKNTAGETFYPIQSIDGTTVIIGSSPNTNGDSANLLGYTGTTETVNLYKREPVQGVDNLSGLNSSWGTVTAIGTAAAPITISGGWDTASSMTTQTGDSWFTMKSITDLGMKISGAWITITKLNFTAHRFGIYNNGALFCTFDGLQVTGQSEYGLYAEVTAAYNTYNNLNFQCNGVTGLSMGTNDLSTGGLFHGNATYGLLTTGSGSVMRTPITRNNGSQGLSTSTAGVTRIYDAASSNNAVASLRSGQGRTILFNCVLSDTVEVTISTVYLGAVVYSQNHDGVAGVTKIFKDGGTILSDTGADREKASGTAWKLSVTSAARDVNYPFNFGELQSGSHEGIKIACLANLAVTVSARVKRDNTGITLKMVCPGGQISGVPSDVVATAAASASTYETLTITFTPTVSGVVDILFLAYGGTTYNAWVDRLAALTQA